MSIARSQARIEERPVEPRAGTGPFAAARVAALLDEAVLRGSYDEVMEELIGILRQKEYGIADLLEDVAAAKDRFGIQAVSVFDRLLAACVDRTSLIHEAAIENMLHGFCELDEQGRVIYANSALLRLLPDCEGEELAGYFDGEAGLVRSALNGVGGQGVARLELRVGDRVRPVRAEFGQVTRGKAAAFAFVTDLTHEEKAQQRILDKAEFGILKLTPERIITYANEAACDLLGTVPEQIIGLNAADFVAEEDDRSRMAAHLKLRHEGVGTEYDLQIKPLESDRRVHVRVRSMPETDLEDHLAGILVTLSPIDAEVAAKGILAEIARAEGSRQLFDAVVERLKPLVPFDYASLSIFTEGREFSRALYISPDDRETDVRWIPLPPALRNLHQVGSPYGSDMRETMLAAPGGRELYEHPAVQEFLRKGQRSWVTVSVEGAGWDGVLTLTHSDRDCYDDETVDKLDKAGVANAMHAVLKLEHEDENQFQLQLIKSMAATTSDTDLASLVVRELARFYGWHNVSVFKVNPIKGQFVLLDQAQSGRNGFALPSRYRQPIDTGFLGKALRENRPIEVGDAEDEETAREYVRVSELTRAEMCVPVRVEGKVVWILNLEDRRAHAFAGPDRATVQRLMQELEPSLERALSATLLDQVLDDAPDGVIITDSEGNIIKCNFNAREMLGGAPIGAPLESFFDERSEGPDAVARLTNINIPIPATLIALDGVTATKVLIRTRIPSDEYDRRVVILQDREKLAWQAETRRLIETLTELTAQVRIPLSLASTFLREIKRSAAESVPELAQIAEYAIEQLGQVDLSYDQVISHAGHGDRRAPVEVAGKLRETVAGLPSQHRAHIKLDLVCGLPLILADEEQFVTCLRSMLAYMLRVGDPAAPITVRVRAPGDGIAITLFKQHREELLAQAAGRRDGSSPSMDTILEEARALCALDEPRLHQFAGTTGGVFRRRRSLDGETLRLVLRPGD